jgi:REP element-mobilizing transposase RayT
MPEKDSPTSSSDSRAAAGANKRGASATAKVRRGQQGTFAFHPAARKRSRSRRATSNRRNVTHSRRPAVKGTHPIHVTLRGHRSAPSFRSDLITLLARGVFEELSVRPDKDEKVFESSSNPGQDLPPSRLMKAARAVAARRHRHLRDRGVACLGLPRRHDPKRVRQVWLRRRRATDDIASGFDVVHYSLQHDHIHLIVEAVDAHALSCGMRRLVIRLANRINAVVRRARKGKIWGDRYHRHDLRGPREVRNALVYVLQNGRKHGVVAEGELDRFSSAHEQDIWDDMRTDAPPGGLAPRTWLLRVGWAKHGGLLRVVEMPRLSAPKP